MFIKENMENTEKSIEEKNWSLIKKIFWLFCGISFWPFNAKQALFSMLIILLPFLNIVWAHYIWLHILVKICNDEAAVY